MSVTFISLSLSESSLSKIELDSLLSLINVQLCTLAPVRHEAKAYHANGTENDILERE